MTPVGRKKQAGEFNFGTIMLILLLAIAGVSLFKLSGPFMDDIAVKNSLEAVESESSSASLSPSQIRDVINKRLAINSVKPLADHEILIRKEEGDILVDISYERRVKMYANIDAAIKFDHSAILK